MTFKRDKWYVVDMFGNDGEPEILAEQFDTKAEAEKYRNSVNISGDCVVAQFRVTDPVRRVGRLFPVDR